MRLRAAIAASCLGVTIAGADATAARPDRFDEQQAFAFLRRQVALGPRPAGSPASRRLAALLRASVPNGRYQAVPGGLRNVVGVVRGRTSRLVVLGAHYDTYDAPRFVGANDGASGTAVVRQIARTIRPRQLRPTIVFVFFDGEELPPGAPPAEFEQHALRGSKVAARAFRRAEAMILLDMVGDRRLSIPREQNSDRGLWVKLRAAAARAGAARAFPPATTSAILDDHIPFRNVGVRSIDVIDFDFACWHRPCDNLAAVSPRSIDLAGETVLELLRSL